MTNKLVSKRELEINLTMRPVWELKDLFNLLDHMPLVDGGFTRHGHWIRTPYTDYDDTYECSVCGDSWTFIEGTPKDNEAYYCPKCGAKMDEVEDETD